MLDRVRKIVPPECLVDHCRVGRCSAVAGERCAKFLWVDLECALGTEETKRCDRLFFGIEGPKMRRWVAAIEFKSGKPVIGEAARQLQAGADYASQFLQDGKEANFQAIIIHGGSIRKPELEKIRSNMKRISFLGKAVPVRVVRMHAKLPLAH